MVYLAKENLVNLTLSHNQSRIMSLKEAMQECILIIKNIKQIVFEYIISIYLMSSFFIFQKNKFDMHAYFMRPYTVKWQGNSLQIQKWQRNIDPSPVYNG
jgi:hypothetical protein